MGLTREAVFELIGVSEADAHMDAYLGRPDIQASVQQTSLLSPLEQAEERLAPFVASSHNAAPLIYSEAYSQAFGCQVYFKDESAVVIGSFKLRGALNKILGLSAAERAAGLVAASAGNHAQGVAYAARVSGAQATVFMPHTTPDSKKQAVAALGASIVEVGTSFEQAEQASHDFLHTHSDQTLVHPFDDQAVILGQATVGTEIFAQVQPTHIFAPVGGGGLLAGLCLAAFERQPQALPTIYGVEPAGSAAFNASFNANARVMINEPQTHAEGAAVRQLGELPYAHISQYPRARPYVVAESALIQDTVTINEYLGRPIECTAALGFTAMQNYHRQRSFQPDDIVVGVITGRHRNETDYAAFKASHRLTITV